MLKNNLLHHGGIIVTNKCTAACRHCLYASSPERSEDYINLEDAHKIASALRLGGCRSVHIGGGEPFINFDKLLDVIHGVSSAGISIEYIETNAFWVNDDRAVINKLIKLVNAGVDTLCISVDPFHIEYVPYAKPLRLVKLCGQAGMGCFLWQQRFLSGISHLDPAKIHSRMELEKAISQNYLYETAKAYGLNYGGRAVNIEMEYAHLRSADELINNRPCYKLLSGDHFHVDPQGKYIPPGCTGISIPIEDVINGIPEKRYPVFEMLYEYGISGLIRYAKEQGFVPDENGYSSTCTLCFFARRWLAKNAPSPELDIEHYDASMSLY